MESKKIGIFTGIATAVGVALGSTAFVSLGNGAGSGGMWFIYAILIVGLIYLCFAMSACELNDILPGCKGNAGRLLERAFGPSISIVLNITTYFIISVVAGAAETIFVSRAVHNTLLPNVPYQYIALAILLLVIVVNLVGVDMFAKVQNVVCAFLVITLFILAIVGSFGLSSNMEVITGNVPTVTGVKGIIELTSWAYYLFLAIDMVLPLAGTMKKPKKNIRISLCGGIMLLMVLYSMLSLGLYKYLPLDVLAVDTMPNVTFGKALFGQLGYYWMIVAVIFAAVSTENTLVFAPSIDLQGCAYAGLFPKFFTKKNKEDAPYPWIVLICSLQIIICLCFGNANLDILIMVACGFYIIVFMLFHIAALKFRIMYPKAKRDKKFVLFHLPQIIGMLGLIVVEYTVLRDTSVLLILLIGGAALLGYAVLWCKYGMKVSPFKANVTEKVDEWTEGEEEMIAPEGVEEEVPVYGAVTFGTGHVITISRDFGSLGRPIAKKVAKKLQFNLYDPKLVRMAAQKMNVEVDELLAYDDQKVINPLSESRFAAMANPLGFGDSIKQRKLFNIQKGIIKDIAEKENAVIVGRAADYVLTKAGKKEIIRFHITGSYEHRFKNCIEELNLGEAEAREHIRIIDKARQKFYKEVTGVEFESPAYRDFIINGDSYSEDEIVDLICSMANAKFANS